VTKRLYSIALFCALLLFRSAPANAGILEWIDQLSGPGPFWGFAREARLHCVPIGQPDDRPDAIAGRKSTAASQCPNEVPTNQRNILSVNMGVGIAWAAHNNLPYASDATDKTVRLMSFEPSVWWSPVPSLAVGAAAGVYRFSGPAFDTFKRGFIKPVQVELKPFALPRSRWTTKAEIFTIRTGYSLVPKGFEARDFGAIGSFKTEHEALPTIAVLLDFRDVKFLR
jgi:hypothetical protein